METRSIARRGAPPRRCSCLRRPGGAKETCSIARLVRLHVVARSPAAALVVCVVRAAQRRLVRPRVTARPPARVRKVVGGRYTRGEWWYRQDWRAGDGETRARRKWVIYRARCMRIRTSLGQKKPKAKFARCSGMGKLCPHATASPKSPRKNAEAANNCAVGAEWGGGGNEQNGQESAPPEVSLAQNRFLVFGLRFRKRGKPQEGLRKKKKKRQTARPRF